MSGALDYVIDTIFQVVCALFLARFILQASRADFYNPISQGVVKATDPLLKPMRLILPGYKNFDTSAFVAAWLFKVIAIALIVAVDSQFLPSIAHLILRGLYDVLRLLVQIYWFAIIVVVIQSFVAPGTYHPIATLLQQVTEPILAPARKVIPPFGGLDLSPILVFMILGLISNYLLPVLFRSLLM